MEKTRDIPTLCRMCDHGCGIVVKIKGGRPVALKGSREHPFNRGWLCAKGRRALDLFYSPHRLSAPLIRSKGRLIPAEWEEALVFAAERLTSLKERYGAESLAIYHGEGVGHQEIKYYMKRFANVYGTPNFMGVGSLCNAARTMAETLTFGYLTKPDIPNTRFLIIWGGNPFISHEPLPPGELSRLKKRGGRLAVVDPRRTETASKADFHLPVKPGCDDVLILNMLHVIIKEDLWDRAFVEKWVLGWDPFSQAVAEDRFSPEKGAAVTGLAPDLVRGIACAYANTRPAGIFTGNGLEHHPFGVHTMRLLAIMKAITGNLDIRGGDLYTPRPKLTDITQPLPEPPVPPIGSDRFPLFCQARGEAHALALPEAILEGRPYPIKAMVIGGGNPTLEWPNSSLIREALTKLDFLLVIDVVQSPDSRHAHVVLPACTFLERDEHRVNVYQNLPHITVRRRVVRPVFGLPDQMIWVELAKYMGLGDYFPWESCEDGIDYLLGGIGLTYRELVSLGGIFQYQERKYKKYEIDGFHTPRGKVEIYPEPLGRLGMNSSPIRDDVCSPSDSSEAFPLVLVTGGNLLPFTHWQYRYIKSLRKMSSGPRFEVHPETAGRYGISDGDVAEIETRYGRIRLPAHFTQSIGPDTIHVPQGWEEANANELTGLEQIDPVSGFPNLKSLRCVIRRL
jgi:anaerobic selenocysteine-containing dehydrogenase